MSKQLAAASISFRLRSGGGSTLGAKLAGRKGVDGRNAGTNIGRFAHDHSGGSRSCGFL
jgi:hypothetical protein